MSIKKKSTIMLTACLMCISLLIASCGTEAEKETPVSGDDGDSEVEIVTEGPDTNEKEVDKAGPVEVVSADPDTPKYGGIHTSVISSPIPGFDTGSMQAGPINHVRITNESLLGGNWAKGLAGTGETDWQWGYMGLTNLLTGWLAESWEMPDSETILFHIRHGVHWWNKEPMNGREFTAEDAAFSIEREWACPICFPRASLPQDSWLISVKALDKYTVEMKIPAHAQGLHIFQTEWIRMMPPEVIEQYGNMNDWKNVVGTGAYMLTDFVSGSCISYERNPNYWQYDPIHPENQLPYLDGLKWLNITDTSAMQAGFRTGKIDILHSISVEDQARFLADEPALIYTEAFPTMMSHIALRTDKAGLPYSDVRVRRALNMAIDRQALVEDYYMGGTILTYPVLPRPAFKDLYVPLEEMPESVQGLFEYNPEKAKQLLKEAGYPDGFKTEVVCGTASSDLLSIIKEYFAAIGIDMEINALEASAFTGIYRSRNYEHMMMSTLYPYSFWKLSEVRSEHTDCKSFYENTRTRAAYNEIISYVGKDDAKVKQIVKNLAPFVLDEAPYVWMPAPQIYHMWWPWVENYRGEVNFGSGIPQLYRIWLWHDESLKKSMGY